MITIAHGYGEHIGRYKHVGARLNEAGFVVYGLDHHGHGRSAGKRGRLSLAAAVGDLDQMIVTVSRASFPQLPQFLLGHSMGGAIAFAYALKHQGELEGLILSAPAVVIEGVSPVTVAMGRLLSKVAP
ncbi:MAG: alpha/beta fold hydrolase, partial [Acidobacteriota bacterium]|nr:alpha/beta fold hydrolase [Acidobacteriota bacterium]